MAELKLKGVTKKFDNVTALKNIDLDIKDGEFFVLLGPTGAGKTTTLRCIAGLDYPEEGEIVLGGDTVNSVIPAERDVAMVFQYYTLYPHLNVRENLEFPLRSKKRNLSEDEIDKRVLEAARILHIEDKLHHNVTELSGGEMQRVGIGRAIVRQPRLFLMDEPLSNLDAKLREGMRAELARLHIDMGETFLYVTHDHVEAMTMADRVGILNEGEILQVGTPDEIYNTPATTFVATFVGSPQINVILAEVKGDFLNLPSLGINVDLTSKQKAALDGRQEILYGVRPEDVEVIKGNDKDHSSQVYFKQSMGAEDIVNLKCGEGTLRALVEPHLKLKEGDDVSFSLDIERVHIFDLESGLALR
ncbi:MAG: ABC transporter ATP-binding protein [Spirochaetaceae bacterium]|nr:ABC transporter ATP-binding protein [Spirochaetaceae bacterium]